MAPKKKEVQKLSLGDFLADNSFGAGGSWADEVEDTYASGTQPLPPTDRRTGGSSYGTGDYRGYSSIRENLPQRLPDKPPFTAHLGNLSYDATVETVNEFFEGCNIVSVRIIEDREQQRPKGFAYAEFADLEGLKQALTLDGQSFQGRSIRIKVADPPKERREGGFDSFRDLSNASWERKGPLPDVPSARNTERRERPEFERRPPRELPADDNRRDLSNASWERKGPLSPLPAAERPAGSRDGSRPARGYDLGPRGGSYRGDRKQSPAAWGPGEGRQEPRQEGSRPPRREFSDRPERVPTAAEKDNQWRANMRPDGPTKSAGESREGSEAPPSPAAAPAAPVGRPKLNLAKRTVSDAPDVTSPALSATDSKASPFGAARPIDTAARERQVAEKREQALKEKKEADDKAKEERKLAKEAAAKEQAEAAEAAEAAEVAKDEETAEQPEEHAEPEDGAAGEENPDADGATEQKIPTRPRDAREPREPRDTPKSRATEAGNWRSAGSDRGSTRGGHVPRGPRGGARGGRFDDRRGSVRANGNGAAQGQDGNTEQAPPTPTVDEDGWTTVTTVSKGRRGQPSRPLAS